MTSWAPVLIDLALAVYPGDDGESTIRSSGMTERLDLYVMSSLRDTVLRSSNKVKEVLSWDHITQGALGRRNAEVMQQKTVQDAQVAVALEGMQAANRKARLPGPNEEIRNAIVSRGPAMFIPSGVEPRSEWRRYRRHWGVPCKQE